MTISEERAVRLRAVNRFDRDILRYMLSWAPHGCLLVEDVYPEFGMDVQQFQRRFRRIVKSLEGCELSNDDEELFVRARNYIAQNEVRQ